LPAVHHARLTVVLRNIHGDFEFTECSRALGVRVPLGHALPVKGCELLDEVPVVQDRGAVRANGQGVFADRDRRTGLGTRDLLLRQFSLSSCCFAGLLSPAPVGSAPRDPQGTAPWTSLPRRALGSRGRAPGSSTGLAR